MNNNKVQKVSFFLYCKQRECDSPIVGVPPSRLSTSFFTPSSIRVCPGLQVALGAWHLVPFEMDQDVISGLQHLQLTKEEEEEISISSSGGLNLLEECELSLFGRLLADRHQNMRALKSTLRSVWKMGSDFRIVDVGKNIFQFKFSSSYQLEWVERNGP